MTLSRLFPPRVIALWVGIYLLMLSLPTLVDRFGFPLYNLIFLYLVFFWITQATSWNILSGYSGYFSFGQAAFYGGGMYTTAILGSRHGWDLLPTLPAAALVGGVIAALTGLLVFRLRKLSGEIFALFTLAVALGIGSLVNNWGALDGGRGIVLGRLDYPEFLGDTTEMLFYLGLTLAVVAVLVAYVIQHSRFGAGLFAIHDDEKVAEAIGVPTFRYKMLVFVVSGMLAATAGGLHAVQVGFISPSATFGLRVPVFVILMSVVGGRRHWFGPMLGAILIQTVTDRMAGAGYAEANQIVLAIVLIAATLFLRGGISARLVERPFPPILAFLVGVMAAFVGFGQPGITAAAWGMGLALVVLFIPDRFLPRLRSRRGGNDVDAAPPPAVPPESSDEPDGRYEPTAAEEAGATEERGR
jgi:branched-chain amino acid transport system permease protein